MNGRAILVVVYRRLLMVPGVRSNGAGVRRVVVMSALLIGLILNSGDTKE